MSNMVNKRFSIAIIPYTFAKAGEEAYGRLLPLYLVMGLKSLQVNVGNWEEKLRCEVGENQRQIGTHLQRAHENTLEPVFITHHL